ncbi:DUF4437 domain-containing protein [Anabaena sphaerica FACHB-251]|uniref:DUF4437 domain-containing protein n=1 Tax=Anabaena sphaerica FACHB-251 TaxID=2692883 RepID=A0A927A0K4_9NOST|nr:DUF4437 domain-containing protein [Anabaena sphaerica]MBD2293543.1 DUF4437 domain-containing protein [Anabaena sphaerica FACHB-251]
MDNQHYSTNSAETAILLNVPIIKEDWGGDGRGRMNLSGRKTAISPEYVPRKYQFFDTNSIAEEKKWLIKGMPNNVKSGSRKLLTWHNCGASTSRVILPSQFQAPSGIFTADLELFILKGTIQIGEWKLTKHCYSFIPAGVKLGDWQVLGNEDVEILWMENGSAQYKNLENNHPDARLNEFIPILDSKLLPWGKTDTVQFEVAKKKYLRRDANGGGVWLLAILPHYDGINQMVQAYNEEDYILGGYLDIGNDHLIQDYYCYCPSFSTLPRHITDDGGLFFVRIDRDLSKVGTVLSYANGN